MQIRADPWPRRSNEKNPNLKWVPCESEDLMKEFRRIAVDMKQREKTGELGEEDIASHTDIIDRRNSFIAQ